MQEGVFYPTSQFLSRSIIESKRRKNEKRESDVVFLDFEPFRWKVVFFVSELISGRRKRTEEKKKVPVVRVKKTEKTTKNGLSQNSSGFSGGKVFLFKRKRRGSLIFSSIPRMETGPISHSFPFLSYTFLDCPPRLNRFFPTVHSSSEMGLSSDALGVVAFVGTTLAIVAIYHHYF